MFDQYLEPPRAERPDSPTQTVQVSVFSAGTPLSTTIDQDAPSPYISPSSSGIVAEPPFMEDHHVAPIDNNPFVNVFAPEPQKSSISSRKKSLSLNGVSVGEEDLTIARPVLKTDLPKIKGTLGSASKSTTMKSVKKWNFPTLTNTSSTTPLGRVIDLSVSSRVIRVGVSSGSESFFQIDKGMGLMLAPKSARAWQPSIPGKSQGMRNLPGSLSFSGSFFKSIAEQFSFDKTIANTKVYPCLQEDS
nr:hypothetical protein [Tanacetum cinerariifolium]